jgi:hypothetical protein
MRFERHESELRAGDLFGAKEIREESRGMGEGTVNVRCREGPNHSVR